MGARVTSPFTAHPQNQGTLANFSKTLPIAWLLLVLLAAPLLAAGIKGSYSEPGRGILIFSGIGAFIGAVTYLTPKNLLHAGVRVSIVAAGGLATAAIRLTFETPIYEPALFSFSIFLYALLIVEGYSILGLVGGLSILSAAVLQCAIYNAVLTSYLSVGYLLIVLSLALVWSKYTERLIRLGSIFGSLSEQLLARRQSDMRELSQLRMQKAVISSGAADSLNGIAAAESIGPELLASIRVAEANLRDHLVAPSFLRAELTSEVTAARQRGVKVRLSGGVSDSQDEDLISQALAARIATTLREAEDAVSVVIRRLPDSSPEKYVVIIDCGDDVLQFWFGQDGVSLASP